ncbi:MAG: efflux RND transporter permease subunit [Deltaproteobacteria bacterium]|nr:MAG: efflux RND transporter permease subunit [Deltaproteobacteria bacterium]
MIGWLIDQSVKNRLLVLLLLGVLVGTGAWTLGQTSIDAIPDLSDVQVVIRTEYAGQAPQIVEDQVTYPLTTAMLAVPTAKVVRGYSMFGSSFVYIIFEDGTDPYWARSRVLEQLSVVGGALPAGVSPQLGPDATGVGWVYEYALLTGPYCVAHPGGLWHDPETGRWYPEREDAPDDEAIRARLVHQRVFQPPRVAYWDAEAQQRYDRPELAPEGRRGGLREVVLEPGFDACPLGGGPLAQPDQDLSDLRGLQDWFLRYELTSVEGVSEVASLGGFVKQYQVVVDPVKLRAYGISLGRVKQAVRDSNRDVGGRVVEISETEYMVRGIGYLGSLTDAETRAAGAAGERLENARTDRALTDLRQAALGASEAGVPIVVGDVADVRVGPEIRRGVADWDGLGEVVGGVIVMRYGENARTTIARVKTRLAELERGLPPGVTVATGYDRSDLIERAAATLSHTLMEEMLVVALICILFLLHARSALVAAFVLPSGVLLSLVLMYLLDINANIMSLGGIAIAIGVMVDSSIIMVENAHKHLELELERVAGGAVARPRAVVIAEAAREVGPSLFFSLVIIVVSFLPVFALGDQSGRLFKPLAFTKTFAMGAAALLAVTVIPVLMVYFIRERVLPERWSRRVRLGVIAVSALGPALLLALVPADWSPGLRVGLAVGWAVLVGLILLPQRLLPEARNPLSHLLERLYDPAFTFVMRHRVGVLVTTVALMVLTIFPFGRLGGEFMPPLEEGDLLYMPTTDPGISMSKARELLQQTDRLIMAFPEVVHVLGKAGRAETATDPAPPSMLETTITLERDKSKWRKRPVKRFFSDWPGVIKWLPALFWDEERTITVDELKYGYDVEGVGHVPGLDDAVRIAGLTNAWTMPIKTRIDMLSTGIKTPIGIKIMGPDLATLADLGARIADVVKTDPKLADHVVSAFSEKSVGGKYLDVRIDRGAIARYGLSVESVQDVVMSAMGGMNVTYTVEGRERYPVNVRYPHELRDNLPALRQTLVTTPSGAQVPLAELADFAFRPGAPMVKSENARLTSWVYVDIARIDVGTFVERAKLAVDAAVPLPAGYTLVWSGQYEYMQAANERLAIVIPLAGVAIILLLFMATKSWLRVSIVLLAVPFSLIGAVWFLYAMDYDLSLAVWVGIIALAGLDAETGLVMLLYLDTSFDRFEREGRMRTPADLRAAIHDGAVKRIRPKTMTVFTTFIGLVPLLWADGAGADTMRRLAVPMLGGLFTSFLMELLVYPVLFHTAKSVQLRKRFRLAPGVPSPALAEKV